MGRQSDPSVYSSMALLQERFRQLQRAKEIRQEREVLWLLTEADRTNPTTPHGASPSFFDSELILQHGKLLQGSLYSESSMQRLHTQHLVIDTPILSNFGLRDVVMHTSTFNDSNVDTSLHL